MTIIQPLRRFWHSLPTLGRIALVPAIAVGMALSGCSSSESAKTAAESALDAQVKSRLEELAKQQIDTQVKEYQAILNGLRQTTLCVTTAEIRPEFKDLQAHGSNDGDTPPSPAKLTDTRKVTAKESKQIFTYLEVLAPCRPNFGPLTNPVNRGVARVINDTWNDQQDLYRQLRAGDINWGTFNRHTRSNSDKLAGAIKALRLSNEG